MGRLFRRAFIGKLHLSATYQPEIDYVADGEFDLTLLCWGCATLLELN